MNDKIEQLRLDMQMELQTVIHNYVEKIVDVDPNIALGIFLVNETGALLGDVAWNIVDSTDVAVIEQFGDDKTAFAQRLIAEGTKRAVDVFNQLESNDNVVHFDTSNIH